MLTDQVYRGEKDSSLISEALSIVSNISQVGPYNGEFFTLVSGTDGGGVSIPYPTPYYDIRSLDSYKVDGPCTRSCRVGLAEAIEYGHWRNSTETAFGCTTTDGQYEFESPYFQSITDSRFAISGFEVPHWQGAIDGISFKSWMAADKRLMSIAPDVLSCSFFDHIDGPPAIKIPVSALTSTR